MAALLSRLTGSSAKYEPLPRLCHISECVGSKVLVQGGLTKDISEKSRQHLSTVVEIFDPCSELWEQKQVRGDGPQPSIYFAASASLHDDLFSFGGFCDGNRINTLHRLDTKTWHWYQLSLQNVDGAPMPKIGCGMTSFRNSLGVFGGHGIPRGPTEYELRLNCIIFCYTHTVHRKDNTRSTVVAHMPSPILIGRAKVLTDTLYH